MARPPISWREFILYVLALCAVVTCVSIVASCAREEATRRTAWRWTNNP